MGPMLGSRSPAMTPAPRAAANVCTLLCSGPGCPEGCHLQLRIHKLARRPWRCWASLDGVGVARGHHRVVDRPCAACIPRSRSWSAQIPHRSGHPVFTLPKDHCKMTEGEGQHCRVAVRSMPGIEKLVHVHEPEISEACEEHRAIRNGKQCKLQDSESRDYNLTGLYCVQVKR